MLIKHLPLRSPSISIPVFIKRGIWKDLSRFLAENFHKYTKFFITDSNIKSLYKDRIEQEFSKSPGYQGLLAFKAGEKSKSRAIKSNLEDLLFGKKAGRDTVLVAMGGGVTGDLVGFIAANLHRGIPLIHLPTSLIAQVDSSIGGKVGINHPQGKNLLGNFYHPQAIFIDVTFLKSLPEQEYRNGLAEVIKYAVILDNELWEILENEIEKILQRDLDLLEKIVHKCVQIKMQVVSEDEKESHYRSILNFGHTVGHALEQLSDYQLGHGYAIATGMIFAAKLSSATLGYPGKFVSRISKCLNAYDLIQVDLKKFNPDTVWEQMLLDKKARQKSPMFTLLDSGINPRLYHAVSRKDFDSVFTTC
jgi:3-dehydroquinate synthase